MRGVADWLGAREVLIHINNESSSFSCAENPSLFFSRKKKHSRNSNKIIFFAMTNKIIIIYLFNFFIENNFK